MQLIILTFAIATAFGSVAFAQEAAASARKSSATVQGGQAAALATNSPATEAGPPASESTPASEAQSVTPTQARQASVPGADAPRPGVQAPTAPRIRLASAPESTHRHDGLLVIGIVAVSAGALMVGVGTALMVVYGGDRFSGDAENRDHLFVAGADLTAAGGVELLAGLPLLVLGLIKVADEPEPPVRDKSNAQAVTSWAVTPRFAGREGMGLCITGTM